VSLNAPIGVDVLVIGFALALALLGGLIAGTAGAFRAAHLPDMSGGEPQR
jgi:hypothetical protein